MAKLYDNTLKLTRPPASPTQQLTTTQGHSRGIGSIPPTKVYYACGATLKDDGTNQCGETQFLALAFGVKNGLDANISVHTEMH